MLFAKRVSLLLVSSTADFHGIGRGRTGLRQRNSIGLRVPPAAEGTNDSSSCTASGRQRVRQTGAASTCDRNCANSFFKCASLEAKSSVSVSPEPRHSHPSVGDGDEERDPAKLGEGSGLT